MHGWAMVIVLVMIVALAAAAQACTTCGRPGVVHVAALVEQSGVETPAFEKRPSGTLEEEGRTVYDADGDGSAGWKPAVPGTTLAMIDSGWTVGLRDLTGTARRLTLFDDGVFKVEPSGFAVLNAGGAGGLGLSARLIAFSDKSFLWLDGGAISNDLLAWKPFGGLSTELRPVEAATSGWVPRGGFGRGGDLWVLYLTTDFGRIFGGE